MSPYFRKKAKIPKWPKKPGNRTNMDTTLSFLAKSLDKHGVTLVHITYPPLNDTNRLVARETAMILLDRLQGGGEGGGGRYEKEGMGVKWASHPK